MPGSLLLATHGISGHPGIALDHLEKIKALGLFDEYAVGCLRGIPDLVTASASLKPPVYVLPYLICSGYTYDKIREKLSHLPNAHYLKIFGDHPDMADQIRLVAEKRADELAWDHQNTGLVILAHGTSMNRASADSARKVAEAIASQSRFRGVLPALLEESPFAREAMEQLNTPNVLVCGFFLDHGPHGLDDAHDAISTSKHNVAYLGAIGANSIAPVLLEEILRDGLKPL